MGKFGRCIENVFMSTWYRAFVLFRGIKYPREHKLDLSKYELSFEDDFSGTEIDGTKWKQHYPGVRKGGYWRKEQSFIRDGKLIIRCEYLEDGELGAGWYADALETGGLFEQTYGYFECRCKLPKARGIWSAFWLMPENPLEKDVPYESGTEIDVFESPYYGYRHNDFITSNLHYGGYGSGHKIKELGFYKVNNPYEEFNTYGVEWNKDEYIFYINGIETVRSKYVSQHNEHMILSVEVDGVNGKPVPGWSGNINKQSKDTFPADFVVDYVRAYTPKP